jgi:spore coat polysaccharide biosynthesis protein SpsF
MGSSRLPGKVLFDLAGKTMLERVIERVQAINHIHTVIVATTTDSEDDPIAAEADRLGVEAFRGHPTDVLDRYYSAAKASDADAVLRVTADCPLLDPSLADLVIGKFLSTNSDYCSNIRPPTFPDGLDTELLTMKALETCWKDAELKSDREHVTTYIRRTHPERFTIANVEHDVDLSEMRWTIDEPKDLAFMQALVPELEAQFSNSTDFSLVLKVLETQPDIARLNSTIIRNEGWQESLENDTK